MALQLTSPAFEDGGPIPEKYGYAERNVNPPLLIHGVPGDAAALALIMDDPDAIDPAGKIWDHWVAWNIDPDASGIPEDWDAAAFGAVEGENDFGERGYGGPNPPDGEHTYQFELLALDTELALPSGSTADDVRTAAEGTVIEESTLSGTYTP